MLLTTTVIECRGVSKQVTEKKVQTTTKTKEEMKEDDLSWQKEMLKNALSNFSIPLEDEVIFPNKEKMNAVYAEGYKVKDQPVKAMAYLYNNQEKHLFALDYLSKNEEKGKFNVQGVSNGGWFLWVYSEEDNDRTKAIIKELVSVFAGEE